MHLTARNAASSLACGEKKAAEMAEVFQARDRCVCGLGLGELFPNLSWRKAKYLNWVKQPKGVFFYFCQQSYDSELSTKSKKQSSSH